MIPHRPTGHYSVVGGIGKCLRADNEGDADKVHRSFGPQKTWAFRMTPMQVLPAGFCAGIRPGISLHHFPLYTCASPRRMSLALKPTHATVKAYYETLHQYGQLHIDHERAVRSAFQELLAKSGRKAKPQPTLVPEYRIERARGSSVIVDGALVDLFTCPTVIGKPRMKKTTSSRKSSLSSTRATLATTSYFRPPSAPVFTRGRSRGLPRKDLCIRPRRRAGQLHRSFGPQRTWASG